MHAWNRVLSTICFCFFLKMSSRYASKMHCESCLMLSLSCNWFHFHREVLRHSHTLVHVHTQATQSVDLWPEEPCYSLKYRPASADVRPVWVAGRWSVSDLSVWLQKTIPPSPSDQHGWPWPLCSFSKCWNRGLGPGFSPGALRWSFPDKLQSTWEWSAWFTQRGRPHDCLWVKWICRAELGILYSTFALRARSRGRK